MKDLPTADSVGFNTRRAHRAFDRLLNAYLAEYDIKAGYWYYLRLLWIQDGLTQKELSDRTSVAENTTAALIAGMIKEGLVTRKRCVDDQRKWIISLTKKGQALRETLLPYAMKVNRIAREGISDAEVATYLLVARRLSENLETEIALKRAPKSG